MARDGCWAKRLAVDHRIIAGLAEIERTTMGRCSNNKSLLLTAALDLITERPLAEITIDDLCKKGGVKTGSFYYFFESKVALAIAALDIFWRNELKPELERSFASELPPMRRFSNHLEQIAASHADSSQSLSKRRCSLIWAACTSPGQDTKIASKLRQLFSQRCAYYETAIAEAITRGDILPCDIRAKTIAFAGLIDGVLTACRVMEEPSLAGSLCPAGMDVLYSACRRPAT